MCDCTLRGQRTPLSDIGLVDKQKSPFLRLFAARGVRFLALLYAERNAESIGNLENRFKAWLGVVMSRIFRTFCSSHVVQVLALP